LPKYFAMNGMDAIMEVLRASNVQLQIVCIIGGGNIFKATMEYLDELVQSVDGQLHITAAHNGFYPCSEEQQTTLLEYIHENDLDLINFDLVKDKGETAMRTIENVLKNGKGTAGLSPFTSIYFKRPIEELNL